MIVLDSIMGRDIDRVPVAPLVNLGHAARIAGLKPVEYILDNEKYAAAQIRARENYGYDWVWAHQFFGGVTKREREAVVYGDGYAVLELEIGAKYKIAEAGQPQLVRTAVRSPRELKNLRVPDPEDEERLTPIRLMLQRGEEFVCGNMRCPFTLASTFLYDMDSFLVAMKTGDSAVYDLLDFALEYCIQYAKAQVDAGAHALYVEDPAASGSVISTKDYRKYALPYERALLKEIKVPSILHICGDVNSVLDDMVGVGASCISVDEKMNLADVHRRTAAWGNVSPSLLVEGDVADVRKLCEAVLKLKNRIVLSSGCVVPANAKEENIKEMVRAVHGG